jgi:hypothetical protein
MCWYSHISKARCNGQVIPTLGVMSFQDLGAIGELLAAFATIGTLIYLAIQIRNNTSAVQAASRQSVANEFRGFNRLFLEYAHDWQRGLRQYPQQDFESKNRFATLVHDLLLTFQSMQALYESKSLESETYEGYRTFVTAVIATPGGTAFWHEWKDTYTPKMVASINIRTDEGTLPDLLEFPQWKPDDPNDTS